MRMLWITWVWPIFILLSTLAVTLITFLFPGVSVHPFVVMGFLFVIPGITVIRFFHLKDLAVEWMLALVLSFTIDAFVAGIILYAHLWSPIHIISFLIGFCFSGAIAQLAIIRPDSDVRKSLLSAIEDEVTIDLAVSLPSPIEDEVTIDLAVSLPSPIEDEVTINLSTSLPSPIEDEVTIDLDNVEDPEDTKELPAILRKRHQSRQDDTEEKTIVLYKPELLGKEA